MKWKIFYSFSLLIGLLIAAGIVSIIEFKLLSNTFEKVLENNYKSIEASKEMLESLERADSGILLYFLGEKSEAREIISLADQTFTSSFEIARNNITEINEEGLIQSIDSHYIDYKRNVDLLLADHMADENIKWYKSNIIQAFKSLKTSVNSLLELNQSSLYSTAAKLKDKSTRAIMPGIVSIFAAILFSAVLIFFISRYLVKPIQEITAKVNSYKPGAPGIDTTISNSKEFNDLEKAINQLIIRLQRKS